MSRTCKWIAFLITLDIVVSAVLLTMLPDKTQATMACLSDAIK